MRIGLFGGTFNPIHRCHLQIAAQTKERAALDQVLFIPSNEPPHKTSTDLAPASHRYAMIELAIEGQAAFRVSDVELRRPSKSYSIDTVLALQDAFGPSTDLVFLLGLDSFVDFPSWKRAGDLLGLCDFVVVSRPRAAFAALAEMPLLPPLDPRALAALDAGRADRLEVKLDARTTLTLLSLPPCSVSASDIRRRIRSHEGVSGLLPPAVESYIIRHGLYREDPHRR